MATDIGILEIIIKNNLFYTFAHLKRRFFNKFIYSFELLEFALNE